ncbi:hypothetical protein CYR55_22985, partial [Chimaeribacter californicus]
MSQKLIKTTLPSVQFRDHAELVANRLRHMGHTLLEELTPEDVSLSYFARTAIADQVNPVQLRLLKAVERSGRTVAITSPGCGIQEACAMVALHRLVSRRNRQVLIISPHEFILRRCAQYLKTGQDSSVLLLAETFFSTRTEHAIAADEQLKWSIRWDPMEYASPESLAHALTGVGTVILDCAHQYTPEFIAALTAAVSPAQQLLVTGFDVNRGLTLLEHDPLFTTVRAGAHESSLITPAFLMHKRDQYMELPEVFERLFQIPFDCG